MGGPDDRALLVTARRRLADEFARGRIPVVTTSLTEFATVPAAVESLIGGGRVTP